METSISAKLLELGFEIGKPIIPIANYVQTKILRCSLFVSGQLPVRNGELIYKGKVGQSLTIEEGKEAAKLCAINVLNQIILAIDDDLQKIKSCIKLEVFVNCEATFERHSEIANGASEILIQVLGERGKHVRVAIGVSSLPLNSAVEVTAIFEINNEKGE
jgi:enamine deaminase RidA (YjgF/YER057c/UK114 family)